MGQAPKPTFRGNQMFVVFGKKRSGKSVLAEWIFRNIRMNRKAIINPKNDQRLAKLYPNRVTKTPLKIIGEPVNIIVPPTVMDKKKYDPWIKPLYDMGNLFVYFDEVGTMTTAGTYAPNIQSIVQLGAGRGIGSLFVSQRVRNIPGFIRSEGDHFFVFRLQNASDRDALAEDTSVNWDEAGKLDAAAHEYLYYGPGLDHPVRMSPLKNVQYADLYNG